MATERQAPNTLLASAGLNGAVTDVDDDPDSPDGLDMDATGNNINTDARFSFPTPSDALTNGADLQEFKAAVSEFDTGQTGTPEARLELWEAGSLVRAGTNVNVTSQQQIITFTWNATEISAAADVECKFVGTKSGGSPTARNTVNLDAIEWNAEIDSSQSLTSVGLHDAGPSFFSPQLNQNLISVGVFDTVPTFFGPQLDSNLTSVGLFDASVTFFGTTVANEQNLTSVGVFTAAATFFAPEVRLTQSVTSVGVHDASVAFFGPQLDYNLTSIGLFDAGPTFPTITVANEQNLTLPLFNSAPTLFGPEVRLTQSLTAPLFGASVTFFSPQLDQNLASVGVFDASVTFFSPTVSLSIVSLTAPLFGASAIFFSPQLDHTLALGVFDAAPIFFTIQSTLAPVGKIGPVLQLTLGSVPQLTLTLGTPSQKVLTLGTPSTIVLSLGG